MDDVHIIGSGPAGSVCARELARQGKSVLVSEEHSRIGSPVQCSGLISIEGLGSLGIDYSNAIQHKLSGARIHSPGLGMMRVGGGKVRACVVDRQALDQLLSDSAAREGAKIETGTRATKASLDGKLIIGADGAGSSVASWFGFPKTSEFAVCLQADFDGADVKDAETLDMFLSNERFPGFFGWVIPLGSSRARVGMGAYFDTSAGKPPELKRLFESFLAWKPVTQVISGAKKTASGGGAIPMRARKETVRGKALLVGDAAGHVKATTGGGVAFGCAGAQIAASCIAEGKPEAFDAAWRAELGRDLSLHRKIRSFLNSLSDSRMEYLFGMAKALGAEAFLNQHGDMDRLGRMEDSAREGGYSPLLSAAHSLIGGLDS